jgi:SlyX protein
MNEERLVDIEVKLAHQEQLLIDLDQVVTDQQAKIMRLEELCNELIERVRSVGEGAMEVPQDERPPHY